MDCKKAQELIAPFINDQLNTEETKALLEHIDSCADCREELEFSYSIMTAMKQLDDGTALSDNYIAELDKKIENCYMEGLRKKKACARRRIALAVLVFGMLFMTGSVASEKRCMQEEKVFQELFGVGGGKTDEAGEKQEASGEEDPEAGVLEETGKLRENGE